MDIKNNYPSLKIKNITLKNGETINFNNDDVVILVGANNVGKSRFLKEIKEEMFESNKKKYIIHNIVFEEKNFDSLSMSDYFENDLSISQDEYGNYNYYVENNCSGYSKASIESLDFSYSNNSYYYKLFVQYLSTDNRLSSSQRFYENTTGNEITRDIIEKIKKNSNVLNRINDVLFSIFGLGLDTFNFRSSNGYCHVFKVGNKETITKLQKTNRWESEKILEQMENLDEQGDGLRSAVSILATLATNEKSIVLIDEPETFLHPPQAKMIGKSLVDVSKGKQCFIATHNIDIIRGILESKSNRVKIIKLEREENNNYFYTLDSEDINKISSNKSLKYTNILNGLFYNQVVLCEDESDCRFYSAILQCVDSKIYQNTLFCGVGGKDQFKKIIPLLENIHIKYLIISDIDLINDKTRLKALINSIQENLYNEIDPIHFTFLDEYEKKYAAILKKQKEIKDEINSTFTKAPYISEQTIDKIIDILKIKRGINNLKESGKSSIPQGNAMRCFNEINHFLKTHHIHILECGEIERFIPDIEGHGDEWVTKVFDKYGIGSNVYQEAKNFIREVFGKTSEKR